MGFKDLPVGGEIGAGQGFPATSAPGSVLGTVTTVGTGCLWTGSGAAQLSRNGSGGKGGCPPLAPLAAHPLIRAAQGLNGPFLV